MENKKILIVDDVLQVRHNIRQYLSEYGFTIFEAGCGAQGLKSYMKNNPDYELL